MIRALRSCLIGLVALAMGMAGVGQTVAAASAIGPTTAAAHTAPAHAWGGPAGHHDHDRAKRSQQRHSGHDPSGHDRSAHDHSGHDRALAAGATCDLQSTCTSNDGHPGNGGDGCCEFACHTSMAVELGAILDAPIGGRAVPAAMEHGLAPDARGGIERPPRAAAA